MRLVLVIITGVMLLGSCASLQELDRGYLNHQAMNLTERKTPAVRANFSGLDSSTGSGAGGCSACAH